MSVGDWFTLNPLNFVSKQEIDNNLNDIRLRLSSLESDALFFFDSIDLLSNEISGINTSLTNLTNRVGTLEGNVNFLIDSEAQDRQDIIGINLQLQQLQGLPDQVNNLQNQINTLTNDVNQNTTAITLLTNDVINLKSFYKKIDEYSLFDFAFHQPLYTARGNLDVTWYQPMKLVDGGGSDLKYLIVVGRGFSIDLGEKSTRYWSDQLDLPIPRVNNNDYEVQNALNSPMSTRQATYDF
jgi:archaellum component FlaC